MPVPLLPKSRAKAVRATKRHAIEAIDWLGLWALSLGICGVVLAGIANFMGGDKFGAVCILVGTAGIITLAIYAETGTQN